MTTYEIQNMAHADPLVALSEYYPGTRTLGFYGFSNTHHARNPISISGCVWIIPGTTVEELEATDSPL